MSKVACGAGIICSRSHNKVRTINDISCTGTATTFDAGACQGQISLWSSAHTIDLSAISGLSTVKGDLSALTKMTNGQYGHGGVILPTTVTAFNLKFSSPSQRIYIMDPNLKQLGYFEKSEWYFDPNSISTFGANLQLFGPTNIFLSHAFNTFQPADLADVAYGFKFASPLSLKTVDLSLVTTMKTFNTTITSTVVTDLILSSSITTISPPSLPTTLNSITLATYSPTFTVPTATSTIYENIKTIKFSEGTTMPAAIHQTNLSLLTALANIELPATAINFKTTLYKSIASINIKLSAAAPTFKAYLSPSVTTVAISAPDKAKLTTLDLSNTSIEPFNNNLSQFTLLSSLTLPTKLHSYSATLPGKFNGLNLPTTVTTINLKGTTILQLSKTDFTNYKTLTSLTIGPNETLYNFTLGSTLPNKGLNLAPSASSLQEIYLTNTTTAQLSSTDFSLYTSLQSLTLGSSESTFNVTPPKKSDKFTTLNLRKTGIEPFSANLSDVTNLTTLELPSNLKSYSATLNSAFTKLLLPTTVTTIDLKGTAITQLSTNDFTKYEVLASLTIGAKEPKYDLTLSPTKFPNKGLNLAPSSTSLEHIDLTNTTTAQLTSTDFSGYTILQSLTLGASESTFNVTPPQKSEKFTTLNLQNTTINPFGPNLADVTGLTTLNLPVKLESYSATLATNFPNGKLSLPTTLTTIDLSGTAIAQLKTGADFSSFGVLDSLVLGPDVLTL